MKTFLLRVGKGVPSKAKFYSILFFCAGPTPSAYAPSASRIISASDSGSAGPEAVKSFVMSLRLKENSAMVPREVSSTRSLTFHLS